MPGIILLGLGPGSLGHVTREAWEVLESASEVWIRSRHDPTAAVLPASVNMQSFDSLLSVDDSREATDALIVEKVLELARRPEGVIYAVPGHPLVGEATSAELLRRSVNEQLQVRIVAGMSVLEPIFVAVGAGSLPRLSLLDAAGLRGTHIPGFPPDAPALVGPLRSRELASAAMAVLGTVYPAAHDVVLIQVAGAAGEHLEHVPLAKIHESEHLGALTWLFVPPLAPGSSLEALQELVAHLRAPEGCPWDREQTHASLRRHLLEEAYETIGAMDTGSAAEMCEEFGDLLLQIMLNSQIASELGEFTLGDVSKGIHDKIIRRHPHVFGDLKIEGVEGVLANWERLKERERIGKEAPGGLLEGVPRALPALSQAQEYQERASRVGFDWPEVEGVLDKIAEEIGEVKAADNQDALTSEVGDLLFALVNLARWKGIDAESALRAANVRFKRRFGFIEQDARRREKPLSDLTLEEMEALWQQAKTLPE